MRIGGRCRRLDTRWTGILGSEEESDSYLGLLSLLQDWLPVCIVGRHE